MGQTERTTKLLLDFSSREKGGTNLGKRAYLEATSEVLNQARADLTSAFFWLILKNSLNGCNW